LYDKLPRTPATMATISRNVNIKVVEISLECERPIKTPIKVASEVNN